MLGSAAMSVKNNINSDVLQKEERFLKSTSKKKNDKCDANPSENSAVVSDELNKSNFKSKSDDHVRQTLSKAVAFLSDSNANTANSSIGDKVQALNKETPSPKLSTNEAQNQKHGKKRHHSVSHATYHHGNHKPVPFSKRRRKTIDRNPMPKFLMGGNITDPLNLNSLADEEISKVVNEIATPKPSPASQQRLNKDPDPVIVPDDITDPLKLNSVSEGDEDNTLLTRTLVSRSSGKKKRKGGKGDRKDEDIDVTSPIAKQQQDGSLTQTPVSGIEPTRLLSLQLSGNHPKVIDRIVSPVVPDSLSKFRKRKNFKQEPSCKISRALLIESDEDESVESDNAQKHHRNNASPEKRKYKRQHSKEGGAKTVPKFHEKNKRFQYGNYNRYYGYRNPDKDDPRLMYFKKEWFAGKSCLDIGCNTGHVTLYIAKEFLPEKMVGIDIDSQLIGIARKNIKHCLLDRAKKQSVKEMGDRKFPVSMEKSFGTISKASVADDKHPHFPTNVLFKCANFVLTSDSLLQAQKPEYDVILCLSVTKWIHLNWGDAGIKRFFRRVFLALKPGGNFILEPQAWPSYTKKKKLTETIFQNFQSIQFKPDQFKRYLLSSEVGFSSCETVGVPNNQSKGFRRPMLMFTKLNQEKIHHHHHHHHTSDQRMKKSAEERPTSSSSRRHHHHHSHCPSSSSITTDGNRRQRHVSESSALDSAASVKDEDSRPRCVSEPSALSADLKTDRSKLRVADSRERIEQRIEDLDVMHKNETANEIVDVSPCLRDSEPTGIKRKEINVSGRDDQESTNRPLSTSGCIGGQETAMTRTKSPAEISCKEKQVIKKLRLSKEGSNTKVESTECKGNNPVKQSSSPSHMTSDCGSKLSSEPSAKQHKPPLEMSSSVEPAIKPQEVSTGSSIKVEQKEGKDDLVGEPSTRPKSDHSRKSSSDQEPATKHSIMASGESDGEPAVKKQKLSSIEGSEGSAHDKSGQRSAKSNPETETLISEGLTTDSASTDAENPEMQNTRYTVTESKDRTG